MKGVRELKRRARGVQNIRKITKALELVAGTKLRRLQERAAATRPFASRLESIMQAVAGFVDPEASPLLVAKEKVTSVGFVVIAADKGLCGSYNSNLFRKAVPEIRAALAEGKKVHVWVIGKRPAQYVARLKAAGIVIEYVHPDPVEKITFRRVKTIMADLVKAYLEDRIQEVRIVYTALKGAATCIPTSQTVIPFQKPEVKDVPKAGALDYILEPTPAAIVEQLVPRFLEMQLFAAILESLAAEFASRRIAMKNATDNADEVIATLIKEYNKARQAGITSELLEITSGAEAARAS